MENNVFIQNLLHKHDQSLIQSEELGRPIKKPISSYKQIKKIYKFDPSNQILHVSSENNV